MPHLVLEYSDNLPSLPDFPTLFEALHDTLVATGDVKRNEIKSRAIRLTDYLVGDGDPSRTFVHLRLAFLDRRTPEWKREILSAIRPVLRRSFANALAESKCEVCLEVIDIKGDFYDKITD